MTKTDFELIARVLRTIEDSPEKAEIALRLGRALQREHGRFNFERFITATRYTTMEVK